MADNCSSDLTTAEYTFLSDVHVGTFGSLSNKGTLTSQFRFRIDKERLSFDITRRVVHYSSKDLPYDQDGDLDLPRKTPQYESKVLHVEHAMSTALENVGLQVWRGALLMGDYLLSNLFRLHGATVLELGAGTGLVSMIAAMSATHVFCTDKGRDVLDLCQRNVTRNVDEYPGEINVREMDWKMPQFTTQDTGKYSLTEIDFQKLIHTRFILAADVIYDDKITDAFFSCLAQLHTKLITSPTILIALERRINFTMEDLAPVCPAYSYFRECLSKEHCTEGNITIKYSVNQLPSDFTPRLTYSRTKELVSDCYFCCFFVVVRIV